VANDVTNKLLAVVVSDNNATQTSHRLKVYDIANPASPVLRETFCSRRPTLPTPTASARWIFSWTKLSVWTRTMALSPLRDLCCQPAPVDYQSAHRAECAPRWLCQLCRESLGTEPLSYQWRFNETNIVAAATNRVLTLNNLQFSSAGNYSVVVTNAGGSQTSSNATLTVLPRY